MKWGRLDGSPLKIRTMVEECRTQTAGLRITGLRIARKGRERENTWMRLWMKVEKGR